jgi:histidine triad (HIT) family protein
MPNDCLFCMIVSGAIPPDRVYEDDDVVVFKDIHPKAPVHLLVVPRLHVGTLWDLAEEHDNLIGRIVRLLPRLAEGQGLTEGFRTIINTGAGGGQEVFHLHLHLLGGGRLPGF